MVSTTFASYSQNGEDVVLWRALRDLNNGRYVDVGANHPEIFSVSMGFYQRGWSGITVEPDPEFARMHRDQRPRDKVVETAITPKDGDVVFHVVDGTGLSTLDGSLARSHSAIGYDTHEVEVQSRRLDSILEEAGWHGLDIHFMCVDTEGSERGVLESIDLTMWRPWILVVEATAPLSTRSTRDEWEDLVLEAGYLFCLFDGISCYYVASERADSLGEALSYPACALDDYTRREYRELEAKAHSVPVLADQVSRWRAEAVSRWASIMAGLGEMERLREHMGQIERAYHKEITDLRQSSSWKITKPLRMLSDLAAKARRRR